MNMQPEMYPLDAAVAADAAPEVVGGKGLQLGLLVRYGLPVPDFFVLPAAWSRQRGRDDDDLQQILHAELVARGWLDVPLAVRSSAVGEDAAAASFAGIYRSCLNVRGVAALMTAVGEVWGSLDTPTAAAYRHPPRALRRAVDGGGGDAAAGCRGLRHRVYLRPGQWP